MATATERGLTTAVRWLLAAAIVASPVRATAETTLPEAGIPQSVGVQLKPHNFTAKTLDAVHDLGFRIVRKGVYWNAVEKEKGKYDFAAFDDQLNHAKQHGIRVVAVLFGGNKLYEDDKQGGIQSAAGRAGFAAFAAAAAARYKDHGLLWEIWNEPNVRTFWRTDGKANSDEFAQEYADLVKAVAPAIRKADPGAFVLAGSVSNYWQPSYEWTEACFKQDILKSGIRGWSVHPYGVKTPEDFAVGHARTRALLTQYGAADMPIVNTERGFAIQKPQGEREQEGFSGGSRLREFQAAHFVRQLMVDQLHGVALTVWYDWDGPEFGVVGKDKDGTRPIETAARFLTRRLNGYRLERRLETDNKLDYLLLWKHADGGRQLVAWTAPPAGSAPDEARPHEVSIQTKGAAQFDIADLVGKTTTLDALKLNLTALPQYVALPASVELGAITTSAPAAPVVQDLKLFAAAGDWSFQKTGAAGSFAVAADGDEPVGVLQFDFTKAPAKGIAAVQAACRVNIPTAQQLSLDVRAAAAQQLTFRLVDRTKQTHQFKVHIKGGGKWEDLRIPLTGKLEHWDGANDGKIHFPIAQLILSVPRPSADHPTGKIEYARATAVGVTSAPKPAETTPQK